MEVACSFKSLVGGKCGFDPRDRKRATVIIPLLACKKAILDHKSAFAFSIPETEVDLILSRAAIFNCPDNVDTWTICPHHRSKLGLGWTRGGNTRCRVPVEISKHEKAKGKWPRYERGIGKADSYLILQKTGVFLYVGSGNNTHFLFLLHIRVAIFLLMQMFGSLGMCASCRKTLKVLNESNLLAECRYH